jgi:hypothetical protein
MMGQKKKKLTQTSTILGLNIEHAYFEIKIISSKPLAYEMQVGWVQR